MKKKTIYVFAAIFFVFAFILATNTVLLAAEKPNIFGLLLVGPYNDHGWSQAHYEAGLYVEENLPGSQMIALESLNSADRPETTLDQVFEEMVNQGAQLT